MIIWRISNHSSLDGDGGLRASGRWHSRGRRIVYCAPDPATALLEILVHAEIDIEDLPVSYRYLKIGLPDTLTRTRIAVDALPGDWFRDEAATRMMGDAWIGARTEPVCEVPSALVPETWNLLINPAHLDAGQIAIVDEIEHGLDARLLR